MNVRFDKSRSLMMSCLFLLPLTFLLPNCRPDLDEDQSVRLGRLDEFCKADEDCLDTLVCEQSSCQRLDTPGSVSCREMCDRLVTECGRSEDDCEGSCRKTIEGWSAEAIDVFGQCTLGNTTPQLTCELATEEDAPSFCYRQIPLDDARQLRCDTYVDQARRYAPGASESDLTSLRQECYILARTGPQSEWSETDDCDETTQMLSNDEVVACYEKVFKVDL